MIDKSFIFIVYGKNLFYILYGAPVYNSFHVQILLTLINFYDDIFKCDILG